MSDIVSPLPPGTVLRGEDATLRTREVFDAARDAVAADDPAKPSLVIMVVVGPSPQDGFVRLMMGGEAGLTAEHAEALVRRWNAATADSLAEAVTFIRSQKTT